MRILRLILLLIIVPLVGCERSPNSLESSPLAGLAIENRVNVNLSPPSKTSWATFRNGDRQLGVAGGTLPEKLELLWKFPTQDGVVAASAIVGDQVYVPALEGKLFCLDRKTGKLIWSYRSIESTNPDDFAPGFKSAPTVTADTIYIGDEDGLLHAVHRTTGKKKWIFQTDGEIAGSAMIYNERVIFGSHDSFLYCLNKSDGSVVWKYQTEDRINCSPAIVDKYTFVAGCDAHLRVIDIENGIQERDIDLESYLIASPAVIDDILYVGTHDGEVLSVNWKKGTIDWRYRDPKRERPYHASAAVTEKYVVVGGQDKQLHCIDRKTGERVWVFEARSQINSSPVIVGKRIFFGSNDRNIYGVQLSSGKEIWKYNASSGVSASPAVGEGVLVIGAEDSGGRVFCFGEKGK